MTQQLARPSTPGTAEQPSLWRNRNFMLLWSGQTVSELGTRISGIAVPLLAANDLRASVFQISLLTTIAWLPYLFFSLPAGVLADQVDQRRVMIVCDLARMALMLSLPVVALLGGLTLGYLYAVVGLSGALTVLFTVAYRSSLPGLVPAGQLVEANGKLGMSQEFAELVGVSLGGALIALGGAARTFVGNALAFLVSAVTLALLRPGPAGRRGAGWTEDRVPLRVALTGGLGFIRRQRILLGILACTTTSNFFVMASGSIEITFMVRELHATPVLVGLVYAGSALGGLAAGAAARRLSRRIGSARIIWVAMAAPGPLYLLLPLARPGWGLLLYGTGLAAFSANTVLFNAAAMSYRQRVTPAGLLGRVNAAFLWICYGVIPLGALFGGVLGSQLGLRPALWVCVLGTWSAALFVVCSPLRGMRDMPVT
ncbi:MFS transporter [Plantactinospora sp. CA-294935]|uniref:MFS transporter n=1 Tax=Plantactinospora sp. CA-294935 TaxID=3240012 RepID=UPI003D935251